LLLVEDRVIQRVIFVEDGNLAVGIFTHSDLSFTQGISGA
jgi:hypothetical protein